MEKKNNIKWETFPWTLKEPSDSILEIGQSLCGQWNLQISKRYKAGEAYELHIYCSSRAMSISIDTSSILSAKELAERMYQNVYPKVEKDEKQNHVCGFKIKVYEKSIVVDNSVLFFNRSLTKKDTEAVKRLIKNAFDAGSKKKADEIKRNMEKVERGLKTSQIE